MNKSVSLILLFFLCLFRCEWISASEEVSSVVAGEYGEFVVTDFGAVGNGVTDDARKIKIRDWLRLRRFGHSPHDNHDPQTKEPKAWNPRAEGVEPENLIYLNSCP